MRRAHSAAARLRLLPGRQNMELAEKEDVDWQDADGIEGLARLVARQDTEGAQLLKE